MMDAEKQILQAKLVKELFWNDDHRGITDRERLTREALKAMALIGAETVLQSITPPPPPVES